MTSKFDTLLEQLGTGKWNLVGILLVSYWAIHIPPMSLGGTYLTPAVEHSCRIPPEGTPIPTVGDDNQTTVDACWYHIQDTQNGTEKLPCTDWDFDNSTYTSTLTSEFQLVCGKAYLRPTFQSVYFFGALIASPIIGFLSDSYGRKTVMSVGIAGYAIVSNCLNWLPNMSSILAARFILGLMHPTSISVVYTLAMEKCEPRYRSAVGILAFMPWILGMFNWAGQAYLIREWRWLMFSVPMPALLTIPILWFVDESPRWLILKGYHDRALKVLQRAAQMNGGTLPPEDELRAIMTEIESESGRERRQTKDGSSRIVQILKVLRDETLILVKTRMMRRITLSVYCIFFVSGMVYYGLSLSGGNLGSDPFIYLALSGVVEIPSNTLTVPMVNYFGRRLSNIMFYLVTGVVLLLLTFIPKGWVATAMALIGKMTISAAYQIIYLHATELYPTQVRVRGLGTSAMISKVGSVSVPYLIDALGAVYWWAPSVVCGGASIVACLACFLLPETLNMALPDTVAALEKISIIKKREAHKNPKEKELSSINPEENLPLST